MPTPAIPTPAIPTKDILGKLGTLKNQLLIFAIITSLIITAFAMPLTWAVTPAWKPICGVIMHFITILLLIGAGAFYVYAFFNLPSSAQELEFSNVARKQLKEHKIRAQAIGGIRAT